ncbi:MAG TPA: HEAT repeat domain-containing protein [Anaerolineales bacterium]|nr:HEAT repeat domain-containing protein [Anaerolineales bacterium]
MKAFIDELLGDFKAAARIGDPRSIEAVMERVRTAPDEEFPASALLPLGETLRELPLEIVLPWLDDADPAVRGIAAAAAGRIGERGSIPDAVLLFIAADPVEEVRAALVNGLASCGTPVDKQVELLLSSDTLPVRQTGLRLVALTAAATARNIDHLRDLDREQDHGLREDLVEALSRLAEAGHATAVLELLEAWAGRPEANVWLITRAVSAGWATAHSPRCVEILQALRERTGENRSISRALERHLPPAA